MRSHATAFGNNVNYRACDTRNQSYRLTPKVGKSPAYLIRGRDSKEVTECTTHRDPFERGTVHFPMSSKQKGLLPLGSNSYKPSTPNRHLRPVPESKILALDESFQSVSNPSSLVSQEEELSLLSILLEKTFHTLLYKVRSERPFLKSFPCALKLLSK